MSHYEKRHGGIPLWMVGALMLVAGGYLFFSDLIVVSSRYLILNQTGFALFGLMVGIGLVAFSARRNIGWILIGISLVVIVIEVLSNLIIVFRPASFFETVGILALMFGGIGVMVRQMRNR